MGDPEAESPKATHHQHVHVEQHDDASTLHTQAQVIIKREQLSEPSDFSKANMHMEHETLQGREGGRVTIGPLAQPK